MATKKNKKCAGGTPEFILYIGMLIIAAVVVSIFVKNILLQTKVIEEFRRENIAYSITSSINKNYYSAHNTKFELEFPKSVHFAFDYSQDAKSLIFDFKDELLSVPLLAKISSFNEGGGKIIDPKKICLSKDEEGITIQNQPCQL